MSENVMSKHTPGPWTVGKRCGQEVDINAPDGDPQLGYSSWSRMAVVYGCDGQPETGSRVVEANARLIAAAPDLLVALRELLEEGRGSTYPASECLLDAAEAAIAKAEGRSQ